MPTKLILPGRGVEAPATTYDPSLQQFLKVRVKRAQVLDPTGRGGATAAAAVAVEQTFEDAAEDDIVEREWTNGVKQWVSVAQLRQDLGQAGTTRGGGLVSPELRVTGAPPLESPPAATTRAAGEWVLKGLKILGIDPAGETAKWTAQRIVGYFEDQLKPAAGLYCLSGDMVLEEKAVGELAADGGAYLIFIHGTASTTAGSFGQFAGTDEWKKLREQYGERILGFQHRTMSHSPIENALDLARLLPAGATLHLLTHSRGGLVGELLCLNPVKLDEDHLHAEWLDPFREAHREADVKLLEQLAGREGELAAKKFKIEKFVRVACPARGTLLASKRLDKYFSLILNLLGLIPALEASSVYDFVKATLLELAKRRTRPEELPGLEAMMPESPVIHLLNQPGVSTEADLAVIAGDVEGSGLWNHLKVFATDLFYREDHDLVVNTEAMYGGMNREQGGYYFLDRGADVNHFSYFANARTRRLMQVWLMTTKQQPPEENFRPLERGVSMLTLNPNRTRAAVAAELPVVFLVPGIMGTHLRVDGSGVWLNFPALAFGGISKLAYPGTNKIEPGELVGLAYQKLADYLQREYEVVPFPYDWRKSVDVEGARLAKEVKRVLDKHERPVHILAHSMGGLVARAMIAGDKESGGDLWEQVCQRDGRLVMLGTPNFGSYIVPSLMFGKEKILRQLALLDFRHRLRGVVDIIRHFPGLLEMLPGDEGGAVANIDFFDPAWWARLPEADGLPRPEAKAILAAKQVRDKLKAAGFPPRSIYVAGVAEATPSALRITSDGSVTFESTPNGDGRVPYHSAKFYEQVPGWYMDAGHGSLANYPPAFPALSELLILGRTNRLSDAPLRRGLVRGTARSGGLVVVPTLPLPDVEPVLFPQEDELLAAAVGIEIAPARSTDGEVHTLRVSVGHGDLALARYPVAVGHYSGDSIVSAERRLDRLLDYRLSQLFGTDLYPGAVGSAEVILAPESEPRGALIVGLGEVGEITPEIVRRGITTAALRYALSVMNDPCRDDAGADDVEEDDESLGQWRSAAFSTLLIGTYGGNALSVRRSVEAIMQGTIRANQMLRAQKLWDRVRIDQIQIVELYQDVAAQAVHAAVQLEEELPIDFGEETRLSVDPPYLDALGGGRFIRPPGQYDSGWWRRIQITNERDPGTTAPTGDLRFLVLTDRARAEDTLQSTQRSLIDKFVKESVHSPVYDEKLAAVLFELLFPRNLKDQFRIEANLLLVLDRDAAQYPWELLAQRTRGDSPECLALRMGLLRQFATGDFDKAPLLSRDRAALVVGVTARVETTEGVFPELPEVRREVADIAGMIKGAGYPTVTLLDADNRNVFYELLTTEYRILHLAGHGVYDAFNPDRSGMVLGKDVFVTTKELRSLNTVPELAFINCCYLAQIDNERRLTNDLPHLLAASIAQILIEKGVKAVVAAGWAVEDHAASAFAMEFYQKMLGGTSFGESVRHARQSIEKRFPGTNTWGAYQCYGNPGFVLEQLEQAKGTTVVKKTRPYSRQDYRESLMTIQEMAPGCTPKRRVELAAQLEDLKKSLPSHWHDGGVLNEFGRAWAALGDFTQAIKLYGEAVAHEKAEAPFRAVEQLANLLSRQADARRRDDHKVALAENGGSKGLVDSGKPTDDPKELLEWALLRGETAERLSLLGSHYKRLALAARTKLARVKNLKLARRYYKEADALNAGRNARNHYQILNWIACDYLLGEADMKNNKTVLALLNDCKKYAAGRERRESEFWNRVAEPDADLLLHLINGNLATEEHKRRLIRQYKKVIGPTAHPLHISSITEQWDFLIDILSSQKGNEETVKALEEIRDQIKKIKRRKDD